MQTLPEDLTNIIENYVDDLTTHDKYQNVLKEFKETYRIYSDYNSAATIITNNKCKTQIIYMGLRRKNELDNLYITRIITTDRDYIIEIYKTLRFYPFFIHNLEDKMSLTNPKRIYPNYIHVLTRHLPLPKEFYFKLNVKPKKINFRWKHLCKMEKNQCQMEFAYY